MNTKPETKMAKAEKIYRKMVNLKSVKRKHILLKFQNKNGPNLTKAGASTYFAIIKKKLAEKNKTLQN